jgi:tetratricopeptide (TPR) repeat protein
MRAYKTADYTKARRYFKELIGIEPPLFEVWVSYIWASYYESPGRTAGDDEIIKMLRLLPDYLDSKGEISKLRGLVAIETGNYLEAKSFIITLLECNPSDSELAIILGKTAFSYRDYETCTTLLEDVIRKGSMDAETIYILGNAYEELGDYEAALMYYNRCIDEDTAFFKVYKRIGEIKKKKGDYKDAAMVIQKYLDYSRDAYSLLSLGECYIALNESEKAFSVLYEVVNDFSGSQCADKAEMILKTIKGNGS